MEKVSAGIVASVKWHRMVDILVSFARNYKTLVESDANNAFVFHFILLK